MKTSKAFVASAVVFAAGIASAAVSVNAAAGQTVRQGAVTGDSLTVAGQGTVWMTGNNSLTEIDMSGMSDTTAKKGGMLVFGSEDDDQVVNSISGNLAIKPYAKVVLSNSCTTVGGVSLSNPNSCLEIRGGSLNASGNLIAGGDSYTTTDTSPWLVFDGCAVTGATIGVTSGGHFAHVIITNNADVYCSSQYNISNGDHWMYSGRVYSGRSWQFGGLNDSTTMHMYGGEFYIEASWGASGFGCGTKATWYFDGGTIEHHNATVKFGTVNRTAGKAYFYQSGGLFKETHGGGSFHIGSGDNSFGYYEMSGGTLDVYSVNNLIVANGVGSTGELRMLGGTVSVNALVGGAGTSTVTFNGGTFKPNLKSKTMGWLTTTGEGIVRNLTTARMGRNGGTFELERSNNQTTYSLAQGMSDWVDETTGTIAPDAYLTVGALTKGGTSETTLVISNVCSYSCGTAVDAGSIKLYGNDVLPATTVVRVKAGATLDLNGTTQHVTGLCGAGSVRNGTLVVGGYVMPGLGDVGGTLTLDNATVTADGLAMFVKADGTTTGDVRGALTLTANAKVTAVNPGNIKNHLVVLTFGDGCTLTANGVTSALRGYDARVNGKAIALGKGGLLLILQ